ncbi:hypothetical protein LSAT2_018184, partial [Lamellibrachia satsuma]
MANLIDAPAKFLEKLEPPPIAWNEWKRQWDSYMIAIDGEQFSDKRKTALLLHSLGTEGQRRYSKLKELTFYPPSATEFEKTNLKLENEYRIIRNKRAERYTFMKRTQTQHESITEYIAALRHLAKVPQMQKIGHYEKVCFAKRNNVHLVQQPDDKPYYYVLIIEKDEKAQTNIKCPRCTVQIEGIEVNILVDSGSQYTIIPDALYGNLFSQCEIYGSDIAPGGY